MKVVFLCDGTILREGSDKVRTVLLPLWSTCSDVSGHQINLVVFVSA